MRKRASSEPPRPTPRTHRCPINLGGVKRESEKRERERERVRRERERETHTQTEADFISLCIADRTDMR